MRANSQSGQSSTEYMLVISVIVIAVVGSAYVFVQPFHDGTNRLAQDVSSILRSGQIGGIGLARNSAGGGATTAFGQSAGGPKALPGGGTGSTGGIYQAPGKGGSSGKGGGTTSFPLGKPGMPGNGQVGVVGGPMFSKAPAFSNAGGSTTSTTLGNKGGSSSQ